MLRSGRWLAELLLCTLAHASACSDEQTESAAQIQVLDLPSSVGSGDEGRPSTDKGALADAASGAPDPGPGGAASDGADGKKDVPAASDLTDPAEDAPDTPIDLPEPTKDAPTPPSDPGTQDTRPSDTEGSDPGPTDTALPDPDGGSAADPGQPDPGQPDPGQPDPGQPDPGQPDPGQPDPGQPDPGQPDPGQPDTGPQFSPGHWECMLRPAATECVPVYETDTCGDGLCEPRGGESPQSCPDDCGDLSRSPCRDAFDCIFLDWPLSDSGFWTCDALGGAGGDECVPNQSMTYCGAPGYEWCAEEWGESPRSCPVDCATGSLGLCEVSMDCVFRAWPSP
jgi:hypothetical protein